MPNWSELARLRAEVKKIGDGAELGSDVERLAYALTDLIKLLLED